MTFNFTFFFLLIVLTSKGIKGMYRLGWMEEEKNAERMKIKNKQHDWRRRNTEATSPLKQFLRNRLGFEVAFFSVDDGKMISHQSIYRVSSMLRTRRR